MITRRELMKGVAAVVAFPTMLWSAIRPRKPVYHKITHLGINSPPGAFGSVQVRSLDDGEVPFHVNIDWPGPDPTICHLDPRYPVYVRFPWEVKVVSENDVPIPVTFEWLDENGVKHPTAEDAEMLEIEWRVQEPGSACIRSFQ